MSSPALLALCLALAYGAGALPFSVWIGRLARGVDIRRFGDHNPGAANVVRAVGPRWGALAMALDALKGLLPVWLARLLLPDLGPALAAVAVAPVLGHATSPLLGFRGGKAVAVSFGVWAALTAYEGPVALGLGLLLGVALFGADGWAVCVALALLLAELCLAPAALDVLGARPPLWPTLLAAWAGNALVLLWKHRADLARAPRGGLAQRLRTGELGT